MMATSFFCLAAHATTLSAIFRNHPLLQENLSLRIAGTPKALETLADQAKILLKGKLEEYEFDVLLVDDDQLASARQFLNILSGMNLELKDLKKCFEAFPKNNVDPENTIWNWLEGEVNGKPSSPVAAPSDREIAKEENPVLLDHLFSKHPMLRADLAEKLGGNLAVFKVVAETAANLSPNYITSWNVNLWTNGRDPFKSGHDFLNTLTGIMYSLKDLETCFQNVVTKGIDPTNEIWKWFENEIREKDTK
jgi:hypothetical protein